MESSNKYDDDEDIPTLSDDTLKVLAEFLKEKADIERQEEEAVGKDAVFQEDWQLSQFWYSSKTKSDLANIVKKLVTNEESVALLSCPSLYSAVKNVHSEVKIFEYDKRFSAFGDDFEFYDINQADHPDYLLKYENRFDLIIADPPFLSEECIKKISNIIKSILKNDGKIIFCSGKVVEPWLVQHLKLHKCNFMPEHERNLGNEFVSYANFDLNAFVT